jgi:hypothetical protein
VIVKNKYLDKPESSQYFKGKNMISYHDLVIEYKLSHRTGTYINLFILCHASILNTWNHNNTEP